MAVQVAGGAAILAGLCLVRHYGGYVLFHSIAEMFSIAVAGAIFMVYWNVRRFLTKGFFLFIAVAYLFVAGLDLLHTLSFRGMAVFPDGGANLATQLWIAARYLQSGAILAAALSIRRRGSPGVPLAICSVAVTLLLLMIFAWHVFPQCYQEGVGITAFKRTSEYVIAAILVASIVVLTRHRSEFDPAVFRLLVASLAATVAAELVFTLYVGVYDLSNLCGHFLKILAFYWMYRALIEKGLKTPYRLVFRELKEREQALHESDSRLREITDTVDDVCWLHDLDRKQVLFVSPSYARGLGANGRRPVPQSLGLDGGHSSRGPRRRQGGFRPGADGAGLRHGVPRRAAGRHDALGSRPRLARARRRGSSLPDDRDRLRCDRTEAVRRATRAGTASG